jgi:hypothetical protein
MNENEKTLLGEVQAMIDEGAIEAPASWGCPCGARVASREPRCLFCARAFRSDYSGLSEALRALELPRTKPSEGIRRVLTFPGRKRTPLHGQIDLNGDVYAA